jgi:hypothetical protein
MLSSVFKGSEADNVINIIINDNFMEKKQNIGLLSVKQCPSPQGQNGVKTLLLGSLKMDMGAF